MKTTVVAPEPAEGDALEAFGTETALDRGATNEVAVRALPSDRSLAWLRPVATSLGLVLTGAAVAVAAMWAYQARTVNPAPATLSVETTPPGAQVTVDGKPSGITPVSMVLGPGKYRVGLITANGRTREQEVTLNAGASVMQQIEWAEPSEAAPATGTLQIQTDPPGRTVFVDDTARGISPVTVPGLAAGEHNVVVTTPEGPLRRQITIAAGQTVSLVVAANSTAVSAGWLRVISPVALQLRANGKFLGSTEVERLMLPAGDYDIEMINENLGFASKQRVRVAAGRTADLRVAPPNGKLNINALPWAEVWVDNDRVGETPIANLSRPIGTHEIVLRHPQFGERRRRVTVSLKEATRLGVDMRQP